jgi:glutamine amidotransferase-like uncharacterized protein
MKKNNGKYFIFIFIFCISQICLLFQGCLSDSIDPDEIKDVALYSDLGADEDCLKATENMFLWMGLTVELVKASDIKNNCLDHFKIVCFPGGDMYQYSQNLSLQGIENIRDFINDGGGYIGICGGAYFTGHTVFWQGTQLPATFLGIFPGATRGPVDDIAPYPNCTMCRVNIVDSTHPIILTEPGFEWIMYCYGPVFIPDQDVDIDILGRYEIGNQPAMIAFEYGIGRVFIIGTHPEFEEDSDRDGIDFSDLYDDRGSDWDLMKNATLWCLNG